MKERRLPHDKKEILVYTEYALQQICEYTVKIKDKVYQAHSAQCA